jgi:Txe/YoeB family toxin of Txe-Axe toxin-antitoxin module
MRNNTLAINLSSSHYAWERTNKATLDKLQEYFETTKSTGFYNAFQKEELWFDGREGLISIVGNSDSWIYKNYKRCEKLAEKINSLVKNEGDNAFIYIGNYIFELKS